MAGPTLAKLLCIAAAWGSADASAQDSVPPRTTASDAVDPDQTVVLPRVDVTASAPQTSRKARALDTARDENLFPTTGATASSLDRVSLESLVQGRDTPLDKALLRLPGVSYDSAVSNVDFHVRNEYANVQYRIDGILLPEGVSGIGAVLDTNVIGRIDFLDGVLPAQYGLRTAAVVGITTRVPFAPEGSLAIEAGSHGSVTSRIDYGGTSGATQYFVTGRLLRNDEGLENPSPTAAPIHDRTEQGRFFAYGSTLLGDAARLTYLTGASAGRYQIPNRAGLMPLGDYGSPTADSSTSNETRHGHDAFALVALQASGERYDAQVAAFTRYAGTRFTPDVPGDLAFDDLAADVTRRSLLTGLQLDGAFRWSAVHTLRAGLGITAERSHVDNDVTVLPVADDGTIVPVPRSIDDARSKLGLNLGGYLQDAWKLARDVTLNAGVRLDALRQYVTTGQSSPRLALVYRPDDATTLHAGYARYFTPPMQVDAAPSNVALFARTTGQPAITSSSPARPERSHYVDVGVDEIVFTGLTIGIDAYLKRAKDLLDDGQFGPSVVFSQFNFAHGRSKGIELKVDYRRANFAGYFNLSANKTQARDVVSNGYLFDDPVEYAYLAKHAIYTDDTQLYTASAGASYRVDGTLLSVNGIFGSGLRSGFANTTHVPAYVQLDAAASRRFRLSPDDQETTVRLSVINLLDHRYLLRSGDGIGEFAPQYGPRRGFFASIERSI